jgi:hypothetical protein
MSLPIASKYPGIEDGHLGAVGAGGAGFFLLLLLLSLFRLDWTRLGQQELTR